MQVVRQCVGHGSLRMTERYLHTLPDSNTHCLRLMTPSSGNGSIGGLHVEDGC